MHRQDAGSRYVGSTLKGLTSKVGYLTLWISPIFEQVRFQETYHGYDIQNFLKVNHKFATREDLKELVKTVHENYIYVLLDILNHTDNVFIYKRNRQPNYKDDKGNFDPRWDGNSYPVQGFNDRNGQPTIPFKSPEPEPSTWLNSDQAV